MIRAISIIYRVLPVDPHHLERPSERGRRAAVLEGGRLRGDRRDRRRSAGRATEADREAPLTALLSVSNTRPSLLGSGKRGRGGADSRAAPRGSRPRRRRCGCRARTARRRRRPDAGGDARRPRPPLGRRPHRLDHAGRPARAWHGRRGAAGLVADDDATGPGDVFPGGARRSALELVVLPGRCQLCVPRCCQPSSVSCRDLPRSSEHSHGS